MKESVTAVRYVFYGVCECDAQLKREDREDGSVRFQHGDNPEHSLIMDGETWLAQWREHRSEWVDLIAAHNPPFHPAVVGWIDRIHDRDRAPTPEASVT